MANMQTAAQGAPVMDEAAMAEMRRLIFEAPIQELADAQGISIDEAVQLRVEKNLEAAEVPIEVSVRPIEPQGKLIGFADSEAGKAYFGAEKAAGIAAHAREIQAAGAKYCDCPACAIAEEILALKDRILG